MPAIDFSKNVESQINEFEELLSDLRVQFVSGLLSTEQIRWFKNLTSKRRDELMNPDHVDTWRKRLSQKKDDRVAPHHR